MANLTKTLKIGSYSYEFVGKQWYGTCATAAETQAKTSYIGGFTSSDLVAGTIVTIYFSYEQSYSGIPTLNISSTGAKEIYSQVGFAANAQEWTSGAILSFAYDGARWVIINGNHAGIYHWGKTMLTNTISTVQNRALTPKAVYDAGYVNASGAAAAAPVQSVNGQTGAVVLGAGDVGALPDSTVIPTKTSDLTNDSGFITGMVILSYGSSTWDDFLAAYQANKVVYCRASSNANPASGTQTRLAFMAYVNNETNPTSVEFQYYRSISSHTAAQQGDQVFVYTLTSSGWSVVTREAVVKVVAGNNMTQSFSNGTLTLQAVQPTVPTNVSAFTNDAGYLTLADLPIYQGGVS